MKDKNITLWITCLHKSICNICFRYTPFSKLGDWERSRSLNLCFQNASPGWLGIYCHHFSHFMATICNTNHHQLQWPYILRNLPHVMCWRNFEQKFSFANKVVDIFLAFMQFFRTIIDIHIMDSWAHFLVFYLSLWNLTPFPIFCHRCYKSNFPEFSIAPVGILTALEKSDGGKTLKNSLYSLILLPVLTFVIFDSKHWNTSLSTRKNSIDRPIRGRCKLH